jgi:hypothetical protein
VKLQIKLLRRELVVADIMESKKSNYKLVLPPAPHGMTAPCVDT